jgi:pantothenate kinase-related protein Tda10
MIGISKKKVPSVWHHKDIELEYTIMEGWFVGSGII